MSGPWDQFQQTSGGAPWEAFAAEIDKERGAPAEVRAMVGSAPEQDRLANLQRYYPGAQPFSDGNFVFTDPETKRPTLYNPAGFDTGDVASIAREGVQAVGATMGATFGGLGGLAVGAPTGPGALLTGASGAAVGAGLGNAAAGALFDSAFNWIAGRIDTRSSSERMLGTVLDVATGAIGQRVGDAIGTGFKTALSGTTAEVQRLVDAFNRLGIKPPAAAVSGSKTTQTVSKALESSPFAADVMQKEAETVVAQTKAAVDGIVSQIGQAQTKQGAGGTIKSAAVAAAERFGFRQEQLYEDAFNMIGADTLVPVGAVKALRQSMQMELSNAPQSLERALGPAIRQLQALEDDAATGGITFEALRQVRTAVGKDLATPMLTGSSGAQNEAMKRIYGALTEDLSAAAKTAGPDAAKALETADRYTRMFMTTTAKTLDKISKFDADERAFDFAMSAARDGGTALSRLRRNFQPEEWDTVAATVLNRLGMARPGAQDATGEAFSVNTFLTNWNRLAPEAKEALFGGQRYADLRPALDDLVTVVSSLKDVEKLTNTSNTGRAMVTLMTLGTLGSSVGAAMTGSVEGAGTGAATLVGSALTSRAAAKLITSPAFVKWLATPPEATNGIAAHIARLAAVSEASPEIKEEIHQYMMALRGAPSPQKP